jgi:tetratricopeptide (TPR) repeat protein
MNPTARPHPLPKFLGGLLVAALASAVAFGQGPAWRPDYNQARHEAAQKSKPLLLEFVSENCVWCKKLETTTLRDPAIAALLNEQYIPIKIDPQRDAALIQKLQITSFPTLLLAAPDGRIITIFEGYIEAEKLMTHLQAGVVSCQGKPKPRDSQKAQRAAELLTQAKTEFQAQDFFSCLEKCQTLVATFGDFPEAAAAARLEADIIANPDSLARACNNLNDRLTAMYMSLADVWLKKGKPDEAAACLEKVQQLAPGSSHAQFALVKLSQILSKPGQPIECKKP